MTLFGVMLWIIGVSVAAAIGICLFTAVCALAMGICECLAAPHRAKKDAELRADRAGRWSNMMVEVEEAVNKQVGSGKE